MSECLPRRWAAASNGVGRAQLRSSLAMARVASRLLRSARSKSGGVQKLSVSYVVLVHEIVLPATPGADPQPLVSVTLERGPKARRFARSLPAPRACPRLHPPHTLSRARNARITARVHIDDIIGRLSL